MSEYKGQLLLGSRPIDPSLDPVRSHPLWKALLRTMNLELSIFSNLKQRVSPIYKNLSDQCVSFTCQLFILEIKADDISCHT